MTLTRVRFGSDVPRNQPVARTSLDRLRLPFDAGDSQPYGWTGQRKSAAGTRVTVTSPADAAVWTAWAPVSR